MSLKRSFLLLWRIIDSIYFKFTRLQYVTTPFGAKTILRVRLV